MNERGLKQTVGDVVRDLQLVVTGHLCFVGRLVPEAAASVEAVTLFVAYLSLLRQVIDALLEVAPRRSVVGANSLDQCPDGNSAQDGLVAEERIHLLLVNLPDGRREIVLMPKTTNPVATRREEQLVHDGRPPERRPILVFGLFADLGIRPCLPERDPRAVHALNELKASAVMYVEFLASVGTYLLSGIPLCGSILLS